MDGEAGRSVGKGRPATLADIAREARVHVTTASRALRGSEGVGHATAERVRTVAARLGYLPHPGAKSLRTGRSHTLGVVVPKLTDLVLATVYEGIEEGATAHGYQTVVANSGDDPEVRRARVGAFLANRVDGLILGDARKGDPLVHELLDAGTKLVLTSRRMPGVLSVTCDDIVGGALVAEHLLDLGHTRIGIIAGEPYASTGVERTSGFLQVCARRGVDVPEGAVVNSRFDVAGGRAVAEKLLARSPRPTALFAVNDFAAIGAMGAIRDAGLHVGEDVAVVGYNDVPLAAELPVGLTTVRSPMREMGRRAALTLIGLLGEEDVTSVLMDPTLSVRASSLPR